MSTTTSSVSGLVSGIDWETTIQQLMAIEQRPQQMLINRKNENSTKLNLWAQIQSKIQTLQTSMEGIHLRSEFAVKSASSSDTSLVAVAANASAAEGAHTLEVLQLAKAHRIAAQGWSDKNTTGVGDSGGDFVMQINGSTITIADADISASTTLEDLVNLINSSPDNQGLVTASVINDGSATNPYRLVLTSDATGAANQINISSNPTNLDFSNNHIDAAETSSGWTGTSPITTGGSYSGTTNKTYTFTVGGSGTQTVGGGDITLNWVDSVGNTGSVVVPNGYSGGNISVAEGVELSFGSGDMTAGQSFNVDVYTPQLTAAQDARIMADSIYMNKSSNTITDILDGVTINLLSAEPGTVVNLSIANDTASVKYKVQDFVTAYNSLMNDLSTFSSYDSKNNVAAPLLGDSFLDTVRSRLMSVSAAQLTGMSGASLFDNLSSVGITSGAGGQLSIDNSALDKALSDHYDDLANLFTNSFSADDSKVFFVNSNEKTQSGAYNVQIAYDSSGAMTSATINGQAATIDGQLIYGAAGTSVEGLILGFTPPGGAGSLDTTIHFSQGIAGTMASAAAALVDDTTGTVHFATDQLSQANDSLDKQISAWDDRLSATEDQLRRQFTNLETLISQMHNQSSYLSAVLG
jgi:flagellar hook-associated protein 2